MFGNLQKIILVELLLNIMFVSFRGLVSFEFVLHKFNALFEDELIVFLWSFFGRALSYVRDDSVKVKALTQAGAFLNVAEFSFKNRK